MNPIAIAREKRGWSQADLAKRLGVSPGTVGCWEVLPRPGGHKFKLSRLPVVARVLGISRKALLAWWMEHAA